MALRAVRDPQKSATADAALTGRPAPSHTDTERGAQALRAVTSLSDRCDRTLPYARVLEDAAASLGAFDTLPAGLQQTLRRLHYEDEARRTLATGVTSAAFAAAGAVLSRSLFQANEWLGRLAGSSGGQRLASIHRNLRTAGRQPANWAYAGRGAAHRLHQRLRRAVGAADLRALIGASGIDVQELGYRYLQGLDYVSGCESVCHDAARNTAYTVLLGVDFIESGQQLWFLEMNLGPMLVEERFDLYAGEDPLLGGLLGFAQEHRFQRIVVYGYRPFPVAHGRALQREGARRGVAVEIFDDYFAQRSDGHGRVRIMERDRLADTLVLRARAFDTVSDLAIASKQRSLELVAGHNVVADSAQRILVPARVEFGAAVPHYRSDSRWPTIVGKINHLDRGGGVSFYKTPTVPPELRAKLDYVEAYTVPDPVEYRLYRGREEAIPGGRRASKIRSYVLVSPFGARCLSSIRVVSGLEVPPTLPDGLVSPKQIYLATVNEGGFYSAVDDAKDARFAEMGRRVGEVVRRWLERKYVTELPGGAPK